ncbi:poly(A)-specific ribonuclease [Microbotryomycetes sp. JL221]|nr:poly(A)-specific ribonuclease [Microbotryomycetes sp. JL221]
MLAKGSVMVDVSSRGEGKRLSIQFRAQSTLAEAVRAHAVISTRLPAPRSPENAGMAFASALPPPVESGQWRPLATQFLPNNPSSLSFDTASPLLLVGADNGTVASYFCSSNTGIAGRYTSYRAHAGSTSELMPESSGILSVGGGLHGPARANYGGSVKMASRRGLALWNVETNPASPLTTFAYTPSRSSEIATTGPGSDLYLINTNRGSLMRKQTLSTSLLHLRRSTQLVASTSTGSIAILDTRSQDAVVQETVLAHTGGITQLEIEGNYIVTVGFTLRQGLPLPDPYLKLHDARYLRPLSPIPFPSPPAFVRFHPRLSGNVIVATAEGRVQVLDLKEVGKGSVFQVETPSYLTAMAVAPTGEGLAFADADGCVHLWSSQSDAKFSRFEGEVELPDTAEPLDRVDWRDDTPLNTIGMPYYTSPLLSLMPASMDFKPSPWHHRKPVINPAILSTVKTVDFVGYAAYPAAARAAGRRNQIPSSKADKRRMGLDAPMFRSDRERAEMMKKRDRVLSIVQTEQEDEDQNEAKMPKHYRKVEIKYSRFGVEDFDFGFYNKTTYSGLETHITNSYTNSLLQALNYTLPVRTLARAHTFSACPKENCLLCEAGFLFRMLQDAKGMNCQASNFSRAFGASPQVAALGLLDMDNERDSPSVAYASLIQTFSRYLLEQMTTESSVTTVDSGLIKLVKNLEGAERKPPLAQLLRLEAKSALSNELPPANDFASIMRNSFQRESASRMACSSCHQSAIVKVRRTMTDSPLPPVLVVNAGVRTTDELNCWIDGHPTDGKRFLQPRFAVTKQGLNMAITSLGRGEQPPPNSTVYELRAMVNQIQSEDDASHLVALARVESRDEQNSSWHLFNDFLVRAVSEQEALSFPGTWKIPAVLFFERQDANDILDFSNLPLKGDSSILCQDFTTSKKRDPALVKHQPLEKTEVPIRPGMLVPIDAEFVSLQQEEAEFHSDGTKKIIRPSRMTLARVSVLRGEGENTGIPFIDDYIHTNETIVDYLTEFSGIRAGDLDPVSSRHTLVPLKVAYKKLRMLVDLGCVFIGHGLNKDFRIINIYVPPHQIIDTVNIYHLPHRQRKLSLRFLAWAVLNSAIQADTHDSIEDARTALQLYEEYNKLEAEGTWEEALEEVYQKGKQNNFKVPMQEPPAQAASVTMSTFVAPPLPHMGGNGRGAPAHPLASQQASFQQRARGGAAGPSNGALGPLPGSELSSARASPASGSVSGGGGGGSRNRHQHQHRTQRAQH